MLHQCAIIWAHGDDNLIDAYLREVSQDEVDERNAMDWVERLTGVAQATPATASHNPSNGNVQRLPPVQSEQTMTLHGNPVFGGSFAGVGSVMSDATFDPASMVLVAEAMTTELANFCIHTGVRAVATSSGSFACHGANLLRAAARREGLQLPIWVTDLACDARELEGRELRLDRHGRVEVHGGTPSSWDHAKHEPVEHVVWREGEGVVSRLLWPHRRYDVFTASLMLPGLTSDMSSLGGSAATATRSEDGLIWFSGPSLGTRELGSIARDPDRSAAYLASQIRNHAEILRRVRLVDAVADPMARVGDLLDLVERYFSTFILFHNTYTELFAELPMQLGMASSETDGQRVLAGVMRCELVDWLQAEAISLRNGKTLYEAHHRMLRPPIAFEDDVERSVNRVRNEWEGLGPAELVLVTHAARVFVAKEWKFFVNKMLFSSVGRSLEQLSSERDLIRRMDLGSTTADEFRSLLGVAA